MASVCPSLQSETICLYLIEKPYYGINEIRHNKLNKLQVSHLYHIFISMIFRFTCEHLTDGTKQSLNFTIFKHKKGILGIHDMTSTAQIGAYY